MTAVNQLAVIARELEKFKLKVYSDLIGYENWIDDWILNNSPCNYNLESVIKAAREEVNDSK